MPKVFDLKPRDVMAFTIIVGYIFLAKFQLGGMLNGAVLIIVGFYFGIEHQRNVPTDPPDAEK